jgi:four helix bundle protein
MTDDKIHNLQERTTVFEENLINFIKRLPKDIIDDELRRRIEKAATSIGANHHEADGAESKKDFRHKIAICEKESKETRHWLRTIAGANPNKKNECKKLWSEAQELTLICSSILSLKKAAR